MVSEDLGSHGDFIAKSIWHRANYSSDAILDRSFQRYLMLSAYFKAPLSRLRWVILTKKWQHNNSTDLLWQSYLDSYYSWRLAATVQCVVGRSGQIVHWLVVLKQKQRRCWLQGLTFEYQWYWFDIITAQHLDTIIQVLRRWI